MDPKTLQKLIDDRASAVKELRELADAAEGREYSADERSKSDRIEAALTDFDARIRSGLAAMESERSMADAISRVGDLAGRRQEQRSEVDSDEDRLRKLVTGELGERAALEFTERRDDGPHGVSKAGPPTTQQPGVVAPTLYEQLFAYVRELSTVVNAQATIMRTSGYNDITMPKVSGHVAAQIIGEGKTIPESDPEFQGNVTWKSYKYAFLTNLTEEVLNDEVFGLVSWLAQDGGAAFADGIGRHLLTGTGTGQPQGLFTGAQTGVTLASKTAVAVEELIDIQHSLKQAHRRNGIWIVADTTVAALRKLKDNNGRFLWQDSLTVGAPDMLLGKPVLTDTAVPTLGATSQRVIGFGDVRRAYVVRYAGALRLDRSVDARFDTDEVVYRFIQRADGRTRDEEAFKVAVTPAS